MARVSIFLMVAVLIAGMVGCGGYGYEYRLTISCFCGGSVTIPGEGTLAYAANTTVDLVAEPDEDYRFVNWTGDVDTVGNITAAATNITMNSDYTITANFELDKEGWSGLIIFNNYGGSVTEPGEGCLAYVTNTTIDLVAEADEGYRFVEWTGDVDTIANVNAAATNITMYDNYSITANFEWFNITQVAAGSYHTVGLKSDGTVVAVGGNWSGQCNVGGWTDITQVAADAGRTVGLKSDGTVVALGGNYYGQCNVGGWTDIIQVAAGGTHTVGLKSDHTVVAVGDNFSGQCNVGGWTDIVQVAAGGMHTVGLKSDGTVVAVGYNDDGQCNVGGWTDIIQVAAGGVVTLGLKSDHTVVAVGNNIWGQCNVGGWTDITQVANSGLTVGLKSDGTVVAAEIEVPKDPEYGIVNDYGQCNVGSWTDITQIAVGSYHTVGLKSDGTVTTVGNNHDGQCNVGG